MGLNAFGRNRPQRESLFSQQELGFLRDRYDAFQSQRRQPGEAAGRRRTILGDGTSRTGADLSEADLLDFARTYLVPRGGAVSLGEPRASGTVRGPRPLATDRQILDFVRGRIQPRQRERQPAAQVPQIDPEQINRAVLDARRRQREQVLGSQGRQSTILTGPLGLTEEATIQRKTLLGA